MRASRARALAIAVAVALACGDGQAQPAGPANPPIPDKELVIGTKDAPPFAMKRQDGSWHGISIDLWRRAAEQLHLRYRFAEAETVQALVDGTADGSFDAAIAAMTVTAARERVVDFTHPFYTTGLGVAVSVSESRWQSVFRALVSLGFFQAVLALVGIAMGVGFVIWLWNARAWSRPVSTSALAVADRWPQSTDRQDQKRNRKPRHPMPGFFRWAEFEEQPPSAFSGKRNPVPVRKCDQHKKASAHSVSNELNAL